MGDEARVGRIVGPIRLPAKLLAAGALFHTNRVLLWGESKPTIFRLFRLLHLIHEPLIEQPLNWVVLDATKTASDPDVETREALQNRVKAGRLYEGEPTDKRANLWCGGAAFLPDGRLLMIGGDDDPKSRPDEISHALTVARFADPSQPPPGITVAPDMELPRWYPGLVILSDGRALAAFGIALALEVFNPAANGWQRRASTVGIDPLGLYDDYPWTFVLLDGRVLMIGSWGLESYLYNPATDAIARTGDQHGHAHRHGGTALLLAPAQDGKVLLIGGGAHFRRQLKSVELYDASTGMWMARRDMIRRRRHLGAVLLPTGHVWVCGGGGGRFHFFPSRRTTELYDPERDAWIETAKLGKMRGYHHIALLLPDGSVLVAGEKPTAEVYYPPYFFRGPRPAIRSAPGAIGYGTAFPVEVECQAGDPLERIVLVRQGTMTHSFSFDQRIVSLPFLPDAPGRVPVDAPRTPNVAPPGHYLLFAISKAGLPSRFGVWTKVG